MNDVAKLLCILVSTSGVVYCVSLLRDTAVSDAGLEWLGLLDGLETLDLRNTRVSEGGVNRLKSKLPGVISTFH